MRVMFVTAGGRSPLGRQGHDIHLVRVRDPEAAVDALATSDFDAVLIDSELGACRIDAVRLLARAAPGVPRLLLCASEDAEAQWQALEAGAQTCVPKGPGLSKRLPIAVRCAVARQKREAQLIEAYRASEERFRDLAESASDWFWEMDADLRFTHVSGRYFEAMGLEPGHILGRSRREVAETADMRGDPEKWQAHLADLQARRAFRDFEYRLRDGQGRMRTVLISGKPVFDADGTFRGYRGTASDVTDRRAAERERRRQEERYHLFINTTQEGFWQLDPETKVVTEVNDALLRMLGRAREEVLGRSPLVFASGAERRRLAETFLEPPASGNRAFEVALDGPGGRPVYTRFVMTAIAPDNGDPGAVFAFVTDLTERRRIEEEHRRSEERYRRVVELAPDLIYVHTEGRPIFVNSAGARMLGADSPDEIVGRPLESLVHPDSWDDFKQRVQTMLHQDTTAPLIEMTYRTIDGRPLVVEATETPFLLDDRLAVLVVARDVTARKQAEEELRLAQAVFDNSLHAIIVTDAGGRIVNVNPAFTRITGYRRDEAVGRKPSMLQSGRHDAGFYQALWQRLKGTGHWQGEIWNRRKGGEIFPEWLEISAVRDHHDQVVNYVGVFTDITKRKHAEEELRAAKETAEMANRTKSEFLASMSHELRTPLNAILGFSDVMRHEILAPLGDTRYRDYVSGIHESGSHLLDMINDILDVSKIEAGKLELHDEVVDVARVVEASTRLVAPRVEDKGVSLEVTLADGLPRLWADERRVKQILLNLLSNAVKFTPEGGRVGIRAGRGDDGGLVLVVEDSGIGMTPDEIPKALSAFGQVDSRVSRRYQGTGLGLPLVRSLTELHGGTMELHSRQNEGTTVRVCFPPDRSLDYADAG